MHWSDAASCNNKNIGVWDFITGAKWNRLRQTQIQTHELYKVNKKVFVHLRIHPNIHTTTNSWPNFFGVEQVECTSVFVWTHQRFWRRFQSFLKIHWCSSNLTDFPAFKRLFSYNPIWPDFSICGNYFPRWIYRRIHTFASEMEFWSSQISFS